VVSEAHNTTDELARPISVNALKWLRLLQRYPLDGVDKIKVDDDTTKQATSVLSDFVEYATEVRTKSLTVLGQLED